MKKFFYLLSTCALIAMSFTFTSCGDDDKDNDLLTPARAVSNLSFTDTDTEEGTIGGTLSWTLPSPETNIDDYVIYLGSSETDKVKKLGEVAAGTTSYNIPDGTEHQKYILVIARNATGESTNIANLAIVDNYGDPVVTGATFTDTDTKYQQIGGTLSWTAPANPITEITGYVIYASNSNTSKGEKIGEAAADATSFDIPEGTTYKAYLHVVTLTVNGESDNLSTVAVKDEFTKGGFYILNCGNEGSNNASLSYYDYTTSKLTTEVYKTANGKGLGDSAEQLLIYGSKMYITITASNRIAVLDMNAKEIKSITPEGSEPMNPRGMVADNGKIYVSYYYGHSVAVLDTASLAVEKVIPVGRYPEQLAVSNGKLYVANSGGLDYGTGYAKTVSVIDLQALAVSKEIEVLINPTQLKADSQGDIYVISMGNYGDVKNTLQRIDATTEEVTVMGNASYMALVNDELYTMYAQWGAAGITYKKYNTQTEEVISENFIQDSNAISTNNSLSSFVNPANGQILMVESPYGATSSLYMFSSDGKLEGEAMDTGGYYAKWVTFVTE
ncbi:MULTISPECIES: DUF5074 domain-containing protein [unclassified Parabacteroides]|uniref:DUF5074 domain-containing protein n=1 Tax=unclassified Parabacteroides TaxID=2649774 RepID=UPI002475C99D|nr:MULTISPECIES: DUF5074 domain-containing protein [unclassified Parabacteroides]